MLKRLVGVITVHNNWAIQSIGYNKYLPLGRPEVIAENFDRWQLDEIMIVDIGRSKEKKGPNFKLLEKIANKKIITPLCYVGGIRNVSDALLLTSSGADRIGLDLLFRKDIKSVQAISDAIGRQAVIKVEPMVFDNNVIKHYDYITKKITDEISIDLLKEQSAFYSELMIVDVQNEGMFNSFNESLLSKFKKSNLQIICFGGISSKNQISRIFNESFVSAAAIGNFLSYKEIPHKDLLPITEVDKVRMTSFGATTRGAREW